MADREHIAQFVNGSYIGGAGILLEDGMTKANNGGFSETIERDILCLARKYSMNKMRNNDQARWTIGQKCASSVMLLQNP